MTISRPSALHTPICAQTLPTRRRDGVDCAVGDDVVVVMPRRGAGGLLAGCEHAVSPDQFIERPPAPRAALTSFAFSLMGSG